jgi:hypothetical protein
MESLLARIRQGDRLVPNFARAETTKAPKTYWPLKFAIKFKTLSRESVKQSYVDKISRRQLRQDKINTQRGGFHPDQGLELI